MPTRWILIGLAALSAVGCILAACAPMDRYLGLSFFFDDVPRPGTSPTVGYASEYAHLAEPGAGSDKKAALAAAFRPHPPYREHRCDRCHDLGTGDLWRTAREGLCLACHQELTKTDRYVHGPVVINDCLMCHHHHGSARPYMLLDEATAVCLRCHKREHLLTCPGRESDEAGGCVDCHDPHGGRDQFFLKRSEN